jgi:hypothetical protein
LAGKQSQQGRGKISALNKGKGVAHDKVHNSKDEVGTSHSHLERGGSSRGIKGGGRNSSTGRGRGGIRCYAYGKTGHMSWGMPQEK